MNGKCGNPGLKGKLIDKSVEAYILALETINRLSIKYRLESFCYLICNAWELLLKAKILDESKCQSSIFYHKQRGHQKKSLSLRDCIERIMPNCEMPQRRNIERIAELRDESVHLVINQIPRDVLCIFQACVINYHSRLNQWFGISLSEKVPVGMMSLVYDMSPEQCDLSDRRLRRELGRDAAIFLGHYCSQLREEFDKLQRPAEFSVGVEYRLVLTKKHDEADIVLSNSGNGGGVSRIIEIPKDPSKSHPLRQKEVIERVTSEIGISINQYDVQCVNRVYNIKQKPEYYYHGKVKGSPVQYSALFAEWLVMQFQKDNSFFQTTRHKRSGKS